MLFSEGMLSHQILYMFESSSLFHMATLCHSTDSVTNESPKESKSYSVIHSKTTILL